MRRNRRHGTIGFLLALLATLGLITESSAVRWQDPTLYHNDDVWYKDNGAPLIKKNGQYYIPIDILTMFDTVTLETHPQDNLLLYADTENGTAYASILYGEQLAAVNGEIVQNVEIFRQNGYYYLHADWICKILGLTTEYGKNAAGETVLRIANGESRRSLTELAEANRADTGTADTPDYTDMADRDDAAKRIVVYAGGIHAQWELSWLDTCGVEVVYLVDEDTPTELLWQTFLTGDCAIAADSAEMADEICDDIAAETYRRPSVVCGNLSDTETVAAAEQGYTVVKPDFMVDSQTNPDTVFNMVVEWLAEHDTVVVSVGLDGCSQRMLALLGTYLAENPDSVAGELHP